MIMESISKVECSESQSSLEMPEDKLPSLEKSQPWIMVHSPKKLELFASDLEASGSSSNEDEQFEGDSSIDTSKIGKWLLFNDIRKRNMAGLTQQDEVWLAVKELVRSNALYSAKCSTVWEGPYAGNSSKRKGVICCYTFDYGDKQDVKNAADSIRKAVDYPMDMFYKTDADTYAGNYSHSSNAPVTTYKHTIENVMYERGSGRKKKWKIVEF